MVKKVLVLVVLGLLYATQSFAFSLLYNPNPTRRCWQHVQGLDGSGYSTPGYSDWAEECNIDNNPANFCPSWIASDKSCPSWYIVTWNWTQSYKDQYPGWAHWAIGGWGSPIELVAQSNAKPLTFEPCKLYETTAIHYAWPDASFKRQANWQPYKITSFSAIRWNFIAKLKHYVGPSNCTSFPSSYVTADFGVRFPNGTIYIIGVIIFNGEGNDHNGNPYDNIYWSSWNAANNTCYGISKDSPNAACLTFLHGNKLGYPVLDASSYKSYSFNMRALITGGSYLPQPPHGYTWDDAMIQFAEVYASVRGADLGVYVMNADVTD